MFSKITTHKRFFINGSLVGLIGVVCLHILGLYPLTAGRGEVGASEIQVIESIFPCEDAYVRSGSPNSNYGSATTLLSSNYASTNISKSYLKFDLIPLTGNTITAVNLKLTPVLSRAVEKDIKLINGDWSESVITWNDQPTMGLILGHISQAVTAGDRVSIALDPSLVQPYTGSTISIGIDNAFSTNTLEFYSKENQQSIAQLEISFTQTSSSQTPLPGDANGDGKVDGVDYVIWLNNYGRTDPTGPSQGDFNSDTKVDGVDYVIWLNNYGRVATPVPTIDPTTTPTPSATPASTPITTQTPSATPGSTSSPTSCKRPYTDSSPWNRTIAELGLRVHPNSSQMVPALSGVFGSDPTQFTYPVYRVNNNTSLKTLTYTRFKYATCDEEISSCWGYLSGGGTIQVPIPDNATQSAGNDAQMIILNTDTGEEWYFYEAEKISDSQWRATNSYRYNSNLSAFPPVSLGRGAGIPYHAGLIKPCEITQGKIEHAIAFAYDYPCGNCGPYPTFVYPARSTDADYRGVYPPDFPEGARLQLVATDSEIAGWCANLTNTSERNSCRIIANALRDYGMITLDKSGHPKIYAEAQHTAGWGINGVPALTANTVKYIPYSAFRVMDWNSYP